MCDLFTAPVNCLCDVISISGGTQSPCDPITNTYTQEVTVTYNGNPTGTLDINTQSFPVTSSPQTETLTGLTSDGNPVTVIAVFSNDMLCTLTEVDLFTAALNCTPIDCGMSGYSYEINKPII